MKRTDVRIGNYIEVENLKTGRKEAAPVNQMMLINWNEGETYRYHPLRITNEWLERFGFELKETYYSKTYHGNKYYVSTMNSMECLIITNDETQIAKHVLYIHHLQNIIHALTGEEITADL